MNIHLWFGRWLQLSRPLFAGKFLHVLNAENSAELTKYSTFMGFGASMAVERQRSFDGYCAYLSGQQGFNR